ncbi:putative RNA-binding protein [Wickerhamomyces ciferrii]|uniref:RNA-binding protein n=1 Tax=Wickerhamomyces ciferrii (strain ATCC 14091 / BCRC 22168 / CBS 111 / JCM 3599 / NBRC 0793 / NRRL Y-1031 F-60-10) TaxID=1206466 RepID=K0KP68_WICCF|nr:putative RNA-binding protein [Wickerhamomyces ciferrii]CCH44741.1 putative RNA-binding protein [Wickerhamomyces ciferrii]
MSEAEAKLTKKQKKALEFRNKTKKDKTEESKEDQKKEEVSKDENKETTTTTTEGEEPVKKKRKTRRGKKGKGSGGSAPRFLLFVGNLPYDVTQTELLSHFGAAGPDRIRIRTDKGIAFLEFDGKGGDIQHKMEVALRMHHSTLRNRKINVELTVGGGGNSTNRLDKIREKNDKLLDERKTRLKEERAARMKKADAAKAQDLTGVHPARAAKMMGN